MGRKSAAETLAKVVAAFCAETTWKQADLARRCGVTTRAVRRCMQELERSGFHFEREAEGAHVYWSRTPNWLPGLGHGLEPTSAYALARLVARLPKSATRERVLRELVRHAFATPSNASDVDESVPEAVLSTIEDGARDGVPVTMSYYSASRGVHGSREVSVQRVEYGARPRFVAHCHRSDELKWFRVDRVKSPALAPGVPYAKVDAKAVHAFLAESVDGYRGTERGTECTFVVRDPDARWIVRNLPDGLRHARVSYGANGARVEARTGALDVLARFLAGCGAAVAEIAPTELCERVAKIARGTLESLGASRARPSVRNARRDEGVVSSIRSGARQRTE